MTEFSINKERFNFNHLPAYAEFLLKNKLREFTVINIRFCREADIPLLKPLAKFSDEELANISEKSNQDRLKALANQTIVEFIIKAADAWTNNQLKIIQKEEIVAEDLTVGFHIRRKVLGYFLDSYTQDRALQKFITTEIDVYTTQEELLFYGIYMKIQQESITYHRDLLLEAQELAGIGSYHIDFLNPVRTIFTPQYKAILELEQENLSFDSFLKYVDPADLENVESRIKNAMRSGGSVEVEYSYLKNGKKKRIWSRAIIESKGGKVHSAKGTIRDITSKYNLLQKLSAQQLVIENKELLAQTKFTESILDASQDVIAVVDKDLKYLAVNKQMEELYEKDKSELLGQKITDIFPDTAKNIIGFMQKALDGKIIDHSAYYSPISKRWFQPYFAPLKNEKDEIYAAVTIGHDITEIRKSTEKIDQQNKELRETYSFLRQLIDSSVEIIIVLDPQLNFLLVNKPYHLTNDTTDEDVIGKNILEVMPKVKGTKHYECLKRALKGAVIHLDAGEALSKEGMYVDTYLIPLKIEDEVRGVIVMSRDVSEIVKYEKTLEQKNIELEKTNQELESFNYIASHDLQEPLRKIRTFSGLILHGADSNLSDKSKNYISKIGASADRMQDLIKSLVSYSRVAISEKQFENTNLEKLVKEVVSEIIEDDPQKAEFVINNLPTLKTMKSQMKQLFNNLFQNSIKYCRADVKPRITVSSETVASKELDCECHKILVQDNGLGFDMEYSSKIFNLFQRLHDKNKYDGTGIGLAICKKVIDNHHGLIRAHSVEGEGTTFEILIPVSHE